jgi:hypothetical protein
MFRGATLNSLMSESKLCHDRWSVGQSLLVSDTHLGPMSKFHYCNTFSGLLIWDVLSDGRTGLYFEIAAAPRQLNHSPIRVSRGPRPYFSLFRGSSLLRRPVPRIYFPQGQGGPVMFPGAAYPFSPYLDFQGYNGGIRTASTQELPLLTVDVVVRPTVSRLVCPGIRLPSWTHDKFFYHFHGKYFQTFCGVLVGHSPRQEDGSAIYPYNCY